MTLRAQCWLFVLGSAFFAVGTAPGFAAAAGATATNVLCFVGASCFLTAALMALPPSPERTGLSRVSAAELRLRNR